MEKTETLRRTLVQYKNYAFCRLLKKARGGVSIGELRGLSLCADQRCIHVGNGLSCQAYQHDRHGGQLFRRLGDDLADGGETATLCDRIELRDVTRIVVTHTLDGSLLRQYDEILVLKDGCVSERGTFDGLLARKGYFYALYTVAQ